MKKEIHLQKEFDPPRKVKLENIVMETLAPKHNLLDFEAWNSSKNELKGIFGPKNDWPNDVSSLEDNLRDLKNHLKEFNESRAFTYTLLDLDEKTCVGCLYIRPSLASEFDCRVDFWFRNSHKLLEGSFYSWLKTWLNKEWGFIKIAFPGRSISWTEYDEMQDLKDD
ncbi:hypothetical protein N9O57_00190 [bacterium]|nr:hypothetical protein [bacterium]